MIITYQSNKTKSYKQHGTAYITHIWSFIIDNMIAIKYKNNIIHFIYKCNRFSMIYQP